MLVIFTVEFFFYTGIQMLQQPQVSRMRSGSFSCVLYCTCSTPPGRVRNNSKFKHSSLPQRIVDLLRPKKDSAKLGDNYHEVHTTNGVFVTALLHEVILVLRPDKYYYRRLKNPSLTSELFFADLAGNERTKNSGVEGAAMIQTNRINTANQKLRQVVELCAHSPEKIPIV